MSSHEGPLAEFNALRGEIINRNAAQQNLFVVQLTISGAIVSFAVASPERTLLLLILPITSFLILIRYAIHHVGIVDIARYIEEKLSDRVPGGLHWEQWVRSNRRGGSRLYRLHPLYLSHPGVGVLALAAAFPTVYFEPDPSVVARLVLIVGWLVGAAAVVAALLVCRSITRYTTGAPVAPSGGE